MDINMIRNMDPGQLTLLGSAVSVMITLHFTLQLLSQHLFYWKNPKEQKAILIIIMMAPLYAIDSFVGLLDIQGSKAFFMLLDSIKECYEALPHTVRLDHRTLRLLNYWTWQFVTIRPVCSILMITLQLLGNRAGHTSCNGHSAITSFLVGCRAH